MRLRWTLIAALCLSACAPQKVWYKDGATPQDYYTDMGQCRAQAFSVANGNLMQIAIVQNSCMQGKGWYLVDQGTIPTEPRLFP
jgi:hypothetical protein